MPISLDSALAFLENRGFENKKQNIRLLKRANFNPELVANFLSAKKALQIATSSDDTKPFALRRKLAKQTQPELFAKFIEAKKALHTGNYPSEEQSEKQLSKNAKRCLTKEEKIAFREQRLQSKLQQQNSKKEEETSDEEISAPVASIETNEEKEPKRRLTKEERISRKLQRIQMKVAQNKDLSLKTEEEAEDNEAIVPTASQAVQETPKSGRLSKEERLARKESRLKLKLLKLSQQHQQPEEEEPQQDSVVNTKHRRCGKQLTKEERLARKEERLKLKEIRLNLKEQKLAKRQGYHIPPRVTSVFIDGSSMSSKTQNEIEDIAKNIIEKNAQLAKVTILYEGVDVASVSSGKLVIASATPLFDSVEDAVKVLSSRIADKKTFTVISGNKTWVQALRNDSVNAIVPF